MNTVANKLEFKIDGLKDHRSMRSHMNMLKEDIQPIRYHKTGTNWSIVGILICLKFVSISQPVCFLP